MASSNIAVAREQPSSSSSLRHRSAADEHTPAGAGPEESSTLAAAKDKQNSPLQAAITAGNKPGASFLDALFSSLFQPGLNAPLHNLMNFTFFALFLVLFTLVFLTSGNIHVIVLLTISIGLWASVNWFLAELAKMPPSAFQIQQQPSEKEQEPLQQSEMEKTS